MPIETVQLWNRDWTPIKEYEEITFTLLNGVAKIAINRPEKHNAFTPLTVKELIDAMHICRERNDIEVIVLTGEGGRAFCSGGDQSVRGHGGYVAGLVTVSTLLAMAGLPLALAALAAWR